MDLGNRLRKPGFIIALGAISIFLAVGIPHYADTAVRLKEPNPLKWAEPWRAERERNEKERNEKYKKILELQKLVDRTLRQAAKYDKEPGVSFVDQARLVERLGLESNIQMIEGDKRLTFSVTDLYEHRNPSVYVENGNIEVYINEQDLRKYLDSNQP